MLDELALFLRPDGVRLLDLAGRKFKAGRVCLRWLVKLCSPPILAEPFMKLADLWDSRADIDPGSAVCFLSENTESRVLSFSFVEANDKSTTPSSSLLASVKAGSLAKPEVTSLPNENGFILNIIPFSFELSPARLKRHFGTLARAIPHLSTCPQLIRTPIPPPHSSAFKMAFCGEEAKSSSSIKDIERSCNSAGRRLVVVR
jgi:hypothetical protein